MEKIKDDIYSLKEKWGRACTNNMELRGTLRDIIKYCEGIMKDKNIGNECFRFANDILQLAKDGGI